jgi:hypothetical protein
MGENAPDRTVATGTDYIFIRENCIVSNNGRKQIRNMKEEKCRRYWN